MSSGAEVKHGWAANSLEDLMDNAQEQYETLQNIDFSSLLIKCEEELQCWHAAAVAHLGQIYSQRLADLHQVYTQDVRPESDKFKAKMTEQLKSKVLPRIAKVLDEPTPDPKKVERMQVPKPHPNLAHSRPFCFVFVECVESYQVRVRDDARSSMDSYSIA